jgi:hypothetical protein
MRISVDLDNTVLEFQPHWADLYEPWFGLPVDREQLDTWTAGATATHFNGMGEMLDWFQRAGGYRNMPYEPGAPGGIDRLRASGNLLSFVTARVGPAERDTLEWHRASPWSDVQLITGRGDKWSLPFGLYIDDSPEVIKGCAAHGRFVIVFDKPWNKGVERELKTAEKRLVHRAKNWHEVTELVRVIDEAMAA